ncbi:cell division protein FtsA [Candidatus Curtissbacteria bacterium RBG_16_39_7]|uniref:Cell division protein FtsA n=1 Tax=Candidatus Curtissbacteria bacterium RBG_16_39_7 TaxID=1797707 RepID=A0A1F5G2L2_9BACT|nr:MAG: cell division protein FtsA [Candidatus Curtissbacteria bacterium RBG_16_39_7]
MPKDKVIVGIDIASSKFSTVIATISPEGAPNVLGVATVGSRGIRKGQVVDIEDTVGAISECLEGSERMAGYSVGKAFVTVGGTHIQYQNSKGVVAVAEPQSEITQDDVRRVIEAARAISLPSSREIIHVIPRYFVVDSQSGIKDPVGMTGVRLEVETHIISGAATSLRNIAKCVQEIGVDVEGLVFSGLASAEAVLSETEKELGVILVDLGGGTTDICLYIEGSLAYSSVLPVGAKNITNDLAIGLRVSLETAEKIKLVLSQKPKLAVQPEEEAVLKEEKEEDVLDIAALEVAEDIKKVSKKTLIEGIMKPRMKEILNMVKIDIQKSGFGGMTPAGLVLTGGGAETTGISELARHELAMPVRIGVPQGATGLIEEVTFPSYAATLGLVLYGAKAEVTEEQRLPIVGRVEIKGLVGKGVDWLKSLLP